MHIEYKVLFICLDARHTDIVRLLRRIWDLLILYDDGIGDESFLGDISIGEVGSELTYIACKIEMDELEQFIGNTSGMVEFLFQWNPYSPQAIRSARIQFLGEDCVHDPEYALYRSLSNSQAAQQFLQLIVVVVVVVVRFSFYSTEINYSYITCMLASCAGLPSIQLKAVSRLITLTNDDITWYSCTSGFESAMMTLAAMANPKSSFRDEFQKMGGLSCVLRCYLEGEREPERENVFRQAVNNITARDCKLNVDVDGIKNLVRMAMQVFDNDMEDKEKLIPELFAKMCVRLSRSL